MTEVGVHYQRSRQRLTDLLGEIDEEGWRAPVTACPGWRVHDVVGHLVGNIEDVNAGELTKPPPTEEQTAAQVERHRYEPTHELLERWSELAPPFEQLITDLAVWPAAFDVVSHEHDVRGALSRPGARDDEMIVRGARMLIEVLDVDATLQVELDHVTVETPGKRGPTFQLRATPFEVFRFRLGRRSPNQVLALDWSPEPPEGVIDQLFMFGPAGAPVVE